MLDFVDCCCVVEEGLSESVEDLWRAYKQWCLDSNVPIARRKDFVEALDMNLRVVGSPQRVQGLVLMHEDSWEYLDGCSYVYLISDGQHIKIGKSQDPHQRVKTLQTGNAKPLRLLSWSPGGTKEEALLHSEFASFRVRGEWFDLPDPVVESVRDRLHRISLAHSKIV